MRFFALVVKTKYTIICVLINSKFFLFSLIEIVILNFQKKLNVLNLE